MKYLCPECCNNKYIAFCGDAVNQVGRKYCFECGDNEPSYLHIISDDDYDKQLVFDFTEKK